MRKNKKLFAILTLVAFMMTLMPVMAFAATVTPGVTAEVTADNKITLTFDSIVTAAAVASATGSPFAVTGTDNAADASGVVSAAVTSGTQIVLTTAGDFNQANIGVTYTKPVAALITVGTDIVDSFSATAKNVAPALVSAETNAAGTQIVLTFDKTLKAVAAVAGVTVNGATAGTTAIVAGAKTATIAISPAIKDGDVVTVSYTATGTNDIEDVVGNKVADFTAKAVTNNVPRPNVGTADITTSVFGAQYVNGGNPNVDASFNMYALFLDAYRNDVATANKTLYVWAEEASNPGTPSSALVGLTGPGTVADGTGFTGTSTNNKLEQIPGVYKYTAVDNDEKMTAKFARSGEYNIYAAWTSGTGVTAAEAVKNTTKMQLGNSKIVVNSISGDPKANYSATIDGRTVTDGQTYESISIEPNNVAYKNVVVTLKDKDNRLVGKTVKIDTNSANIQTSKETATTNSLGQIDFDLSGSREGTYYVFISCDGFEVKVKVIVGNTNATYITVSEQPDAPVALYGDKDDMDIRLDLTDVNGNVVKGTNPGGADKAYTSSTTAANYKYVSFTSKPAGTILKDSDLAIVYDAADENYQVTMNGKTFDKEGNYEIKVVLNNGNYVTIPFEVKVFTTPVSIQLDYKQTSIELAGKSNVPSVKYVDANGTKQNAVNKVTLAGTGYAIDAFANNGQITVKNDEKYIGQTITVTAVDSRYNLVATTALLVADEAQAIEFDNATTVVNANNKINFKVTDAKGNAVSLGNDATVDDVQFVILDKPENAKVSAVLSGGTSDLLSKGTATMALTSNVKGDVTVQVLVKATVERSTSSTGLATKYYTGTKTFAVGSEIGNKVQVVMSIGSHEMIKNGSVSTIDAAPMIQDNRTFVPFRAISEAFGATVEFDAATNVVTAKLDGKTVALTIGSTVMTVGEEVKTLDVAPFISTDRTMVPVRAIAEAFGFEVVATSNPDGTTADVVFTK